VIAIKIEGLRKTLLLFGLADPASVVSKDTTCNTCPGGNVADVKTAPLWSVAPSNTVVPPTDKVAIILLL